MHGEAMSYKNDGAVGMTAYGRDMGEGRQILIAKRARAASRELTRASTDTKNAALHNMAALLEDNLERIVTANEQDMADARSNGLTDAMVNRLAFDKAMIYTRVKSLIKIASLPDPVGRMEKMGRMHNGITYGRMRIPLGVIMMIYEARPDVTVNAGAFALKSGNSIILKGGSEAKHCTAVLAGLWEEALKRAGLSTDCVQVVTLDHGEAGNLLRSPELIDVLILRGGRELMKAVSAKSRVPVIKHYEGNCHIYVGRRANTSKALRIILDSKLLMPGMCNAAESLIVDRSMVDWLPNLVAALKDNGVEVRGCPETNRLVSGVKQATNSDFCTEYMDKIYSLKVVEDLDEAIWHINESGSGHTDVIVTEDYTHARRFQQEVNSSVVLVNASTMFCDGDALGMGADIGISTDKLHARGPMGLDELTTYKFLLWGDGQVMGN